MWECNISDGPIAYKSGIGDSSNNYLNILWNHKVNINALKWV